MAASERPSRRREPEERERRGLPVGYLRLGWLAVIVLAALLFGLVVGFVWATARDVSTLALNGHEITQLNAEVGELKRQLAVTSLNKPQGNWWVWWASLPTRHIWDSLKFW